MKNRTIGIQKKHWKQMILFEEFSNMKNNSSNTVQAKRTEDKISILKTYWSHEY